MWKLIRNGGSNIGSNEFWGGCTWKDVIYEPFSLDNKETHWAITIGQWRFKKYTVTAVAVTI